jgi:Lipocalin-like domain
MKLLMILVTVAGIAGAQSAATPITGVWKIAGATTPKQVIESQGGIYIFTGKYFSKHWDRSEKPRAEFDRNSPASERLAGMSALLSKVGTYEVSGSSLTTHTQVSINPRTSRPGNSDIYSFKLEGNTLWLTDVDEGGKPSENPVTLKLTRVE